MTDTKKNEGLRKWLPFLKYVSLVNYELNFKEIEPNHTLIARCIQESNSAPFSEFAESLFHEYRLLSAKNTVYVPIHALRRRTCNKLKEFYFTTFDFERYLIRALDEYRSLTKKKIILSEPGKREEEGLHLRGGYYYFISIYDQAGG